MSAALEPVSVAPLATEGGQPAPMSSLHLCASLRRAARMLADPTTPPGAVAETLSRRTPSIPPGLIGPVMTDPLSKEQ